MTKALIRLEYTPKDLPQRFAKGGRVVDRQMRQAMKASLVVAQENVPPYPSTKSSLAKGTAKQRRWFFWQLKNNPSFNPGRGGTLAKSLGVSQQGGRIGDAEIQIVQKLGGQYEGQFGTQREYAEYVIGDSQGRKQAAMHAGNWWLFTVIKRRARPKIQQIWNELMEDLAQFLEGKGA